MYQYWVINCDEYTIRVMLLILRGTWVGYMGSLSAHSLKYFFELKTILKLSKVQFLKAEINPTFYPGLFPGRRDCKTYNPLTPVSRILSWSQWDNGPLLQLSIVYTVFFFFLTGNSKGTRIGVISATHSQSRDMGFFSEIPEVPLSYS